MNTAGMSKVTAYPPSILIEPAPVAKIVIAEPGAAGLAGEFRVPSLFRI